MKIMPIIRLAASVLMIVVPPAVYLLVVSPSLGRSSDPESLDLFAKIFCGLLMFIGIITAPIWLAALLRGRN